MVFVEVMIVKPLAEAHTVLRVTFCLAAQQSPTICAENSVSFARGTMKKRICTWLHEVAFICDKCGVLRGNILFTDRRTGPRGKAPLVEKLRITHFEPNLAAHGEVAEVREIGEREVSPGEVFALGQTALEDVERRLQGGLVLGAFILNRSIIMLRAEYNNIIT